MKTGVYFCNCGGNVSGRIDAGRVEAELAGAGLSYFKSCPFLCSEEGQEFLAEDLRREGAQRVVIAACSPRDHEETMRRACQKAGLNPFLLQMVNIREQIAWVCKDPEQAAVKAALTIKAALGRVALHEALEREELEISPAALVIGSGPAGLTAALTLAEAGRRVLLVEKGQRIGGLPVLFEELFPNLECGTCLLEPLMGEVLHGRHAELIELLTLAEVEEVSGFLGNFLVKVRQRPRFVDPGRCIGCGECIEACPAESDGSEGGAEGGGGSGGRKAIDFAFPGALPNVPKIDPGQCLRFGGDPQCQLCRAACPMGEDLIDFSDPERVTTHQVGAIVVATGAGRYDCRRFPALLGCQSPAAAAPSGFQPPRPGSEGETESLAALDPPQHAQSKRPGPEIKSALEFERLLAANGPTSGELLTALGTPPQSIAIIHCVGSLNEQHCPYCSGICCQYAFKYNHLLADRLPECEVVHLFKEIAAPGLEAHGLWQKARQNPRTTLVRYQQLEQLRVVEDEQGPGVALADGRRFQAEMVVLCPAVTPGADSEAVARMLDIARDRFGFLAPLHSRLEAGRSSARGIYLAGGCQAPADIARATAQGAAAAGYALSELVEGRRLELEPLFASVDEERCTGCKICQNICPYRAIGFDSDKGVATINRVICRGCGTCAAACPMAVIEARHFSDEMLLAEIEGVLA